MISIRTKCLSGLIVILAGAILQAAEIHIAVSGADANSGGPEAPVATLQAAQKIVRQKIAQGLLEPMDVIIHGGTYYLDSPLALTPEDSGTAACPITWRAAGGEKVILSGGVRISGKWTKGETGIWSVAVPAAKDGLNFRQLFVNEKWAIRARYPNADAPNPFLYATGGGKDHVTIDPAPIKDSWGKARDAQINIVPEWRFFNQWNTVTLVDAKTGRIDIADSERHAKVIPGNWFWIEGVREELDQPGEWCLDREDARLYYMPEPETDPNTLTIIAPRLNVIVDAKGEVEKQTHVEYVNFRGLEFRHTSFTLGHIEARVHTDAALRLENAYHCRIENCHVENIGGYAVWLHLDSQHNVIDRNTVLNSGGGGVLFTGARLAYMDDSKLYTPGKVAATVFPILNHVTRNTVKHCGKIRYYGGGVHMDSRPFCMAMSPGNYIAHNHFEDLSRNGVFAFRNQGGNIVEYNRIHDAMQTTIDGGCIHFATMNHLTAPNYILNNWLFDIWGYEQKPDGKPVRKLANGIFLDWDTSNTTVRDNWIYNSAGGAIKPIFQNQNLVIKDNHQSDTRIVPPFEKELGPEGRASNRIDLSANRLTGRVIHYLDNELVKTTGTWTPRTVTGMWGLFSFNFLVGTAAVPSEAVYSFPVPEDGVYQVSLIYKPGKTCAGNVPVTIQHADGKADLQWNMREGSKHGFSVEIGKFRFLKGKPSSLTLSTIGVDGDVIADSAAFVKVAD